MALIFISHSSRDNAIAAEVQAWLENRGHAAVFLDFDPDGGIPAGRNWEQELYQRLRTCRAVIVLCSEASMTSKWVFAEITQARSLGKFVVPVKIDDCTVDGAISDRQIVDLTVSRQEGLERLWRGLLAAGLDPEDVFSWDGKRPPYPGLLAFQEADAALFFGRDDEISTGLDLLNRTRRRGSGEFVMMLGASGSGKSSLVRAGLIPRLRRDPERWLVLAPLRPRDDLVQELSVALSRAFGEAGEVRTSAAIRTELLTAFNTTGASGAAVLATMARELLLLAGRGEAKVLVTVDQFEEFFTHRSARHSTIALQMLREATELPGSPLIVAGTMRSDFLGEFQAYPALLDVSYQTLSVGPLSPDDITQVIERPADVAGIDLESGLANLLVAETQAADALPLLAFTLRELWESHGAKGRLTTAEYRGELGGLEGSVAKVADDVMDAANLDHGQEEELRRALLAMVRLSDDGRPVRRTAQWEDFPSSIHPVLESFVAARLLISSREDDLNTLEVAHEALFSSWDKLSGWLSDNVEALRLGRDLHRTSTTWEEGGRNAADLWRGARLDRTIELAATGDLVLAPIDREFIEASAQLAQAEREHEVRLRRRRLQITTAVAVGASILATVALFSFLAAERETNRANEQTVLAEEEADRASDAAETAAEAAAQADREGRNAIGLALAAEARQIAEEGAQPALALALAVEAIAIPDVPSPESYEALFMAREAFADGTWQPVGDPLRGHGSGVFTLAFSDDGLLASGGEDGTIRFWNTATGDPVGQPLAGHQGSWVQTVAFDGEGRLASAGGDGRVVLWDVETFDQMGEAQLAGEVLEVAFDGRGHLATADFAGAVRLWDAETLQPIGDPLPTHTRGARSVAFDGHGLLATGDGDGTIRIWDVDTGQQVGQPLQAHGEDVRLESLDDLTRVVSSLSFDGEGRLASAGYDGTMRVWDVASESLVGMRGSSGGLDWIPSVAFSADGWLAYATTFDGVVVVSTSDTPADDDDEGDAATTAASADESAGTTETAAPSTAEDEETAASSETDQEPPSYGGRSEELPHPGIVEGVAFGPDGLLASAGEDGTVRLWRYTGETGQRALEDLPGDVEDIAFGPDGLLAFAIGPTIWLWDTTTGDAGVERVGRHEDTVNALAFTDDGLLVSGSEDETVRFWDPGTGEQIGDPLRHDTGVDDVATGPDGIVAYADSLWDVVVWDSSTSQQVGDTLDVLLSSVPNFFEGSVAFGPDGMLATAADPNAILLWDTSTGERIGDPLELHSDLVHDVAFDTSGLLASASADGTVQLWDTTTQEPVSDPFVVDSRVLSLAFTGSGLLAASSRDRTIRFWDTETQEPVGTPLTTGCFPSRSLAINENGKLAAGGCDAIELWDRLWDTARACELAKPFVRRDQLVSVLPGGVDSQGCPF